MCVTKRRNGKPADTSRNERRKPWRAHAQARYPRKMHCAIPTGYHCAIPEASRPRWEEISICWDKVSDIR